MLRMKNDFISRRKEQDNQEEQAGGGGAASGTDFNYSSNSNQQQQQQHASGVVTKLTQSLFHMHFLTGTLNWRHVQMKSLRSDSITS